MPSRSPARTPSSAPVAQPVADHGADPRRRGHVGGDDLRAHAARPERRGAVADLQVGQGREVGHLAHERGVGHAARVVGVQAVDVGEQHEQVGGHEHGDLRREEVVVAEGDLVGRRRVVLVDDRNDAPVEQRAQRLARVQVVRAAADVVEGEEHLRTRHAALAQQLVVDGVQLALPDRARRLQLADRGRAHGQAHHLDAAGDRAARDEHHLVAVGPQRGGRVADARERLAAQLAALVGDDARAELDDDAAHQSASLGSSSKAIPPISISSPGAKPCASSARRTPIRRSRPST